MTEHEYPVDPWKRNRQKKPSEPSRTLRIAVLIWLVLSAAIVVASVYAGTGSLLAVAVAVVILALTAYVLGRRKGQVAKRIAAHLEPRPEPDDLYPSPGLVEKLLCVVGVAGVAVCILTPSLREGGWTIAPLTVLMFAMSRQGDRQHKATLALHEEREILRDRLARGLTVAEYWRDGVMAESRRDLEVPYRTMAHPLACAISALTGEEHEPDQMGITADEFARRFPKTLEQLDERVRIEREGLPAEPAEPCWTGTVDGAYCHRGGIGCPRPHADDPPELRRAYPRRLMHYDPLHPER